MINKELFNPRNIVVVGGTNDIGKPGGKIIKNLLAGKFAGQLYIVNPKYSQVQEIDCYNTIDDLPSGIDLAILAIPAAFCLEAVTVLARHKSVKAFIIISGGFGESGEIGKQIEHDMVSIMRETGATLIGPNCIGVVTPAYRGIFTEPVPRLHPDGCEFITGSGATASFIFESGIHKGLTFSSLFSIGNSAHISAEDFLEYMDNSFDPVLSPRVKLLYLERIDNPDKLLKHASSLIRKGCKIAAIKAGTSEAGSRAAQSHTGAMASSDVVVDALFKKAGIIRCAGRRELVAVASVLLHPPLKGENIAIITHAGGPGVMCADALSKGGLKVPQINNEYTPFLLDELPKGSSINNPIDFLATGTAAHLHTIINFAENKFNEVDGMIVIFGKPGLNDIYDVVNVINDRKSIGKKPIFTVLPSITTAEKEIDYFLSKGNVCFPDEVGLAQALAKVYYAPKPVPELSFPMYNQGVDIDKIRSVIENGNDGYLPPQEIEKLLDAANIPHVSEIIVTDKEQLALGLTQLGFPVVMKVIGILHKSDIGGVVLNVGSLDQAVTEFERLMSLPEAEKVMLQPMLTGGVELFVGAKYEPRFGHIVLCGIGGIFVEVLKDISPGLAPLTEEEAIEMIHSLRSYPIIRGVRGQQGVDEQEFASILVKLSVMLRHAVEIKELDFNPLIANGKNVIVVDSRIRIEK